MSMSRLRYLTLVALAAAASAVAFSILRTLYYSWAGLRPEMSPMMFIVFSPILALTFAALAVVIEFGLSLIWTRALNARPLFIGASYSTVLLGLIQPWLLVACVLANPIILHIWMAKNKAVRPT